VLYWGKRLTAILIGITLAWILLELLLRIAYPIFPYTIQAALREVHLTPFTEQRILPGQIWQADDAYQFVSRAKVTDELQFPDPRVGFHISTKNWLDPNSHVGFRVPTADWEPRWPVDGVFVGDSFTFCYTEYSLCWVQRLADEHGMSVVNLGQVATGSMSHLNVLATFGLPYEPRFVVWQWYGNDFNDDYGMALQTGKVTREDPPEPSPAAEQNRNSPLLRWLQRNSTVYWIFETATSSAEDRYKYERYVDPYRAKDDNVDITFGRPYILDAFDLSQPRNQLGLQLTQETLLKASDMLEERGMVLVVVLLPSKEEVYQRWTVESLGEAQLERLSQGRLQMGRFCDEHGLLCLDTTEALTDKADAGEYVFWADDTHLNGMGNQILASSVWDFLVAQLLVAEP
jgi:hypothetical protein